MLPFDLVTVGKTPAKHVTVYCASCGRFDAIVLPPGVSIDAARCRHCGQSVVSDRSRVAKIRAYESMFKRLAAVVVGAAAGEMAVEAAVASARAAAHVAFAQRLVKYGPDPDERSGS